MISRLPLPARVFTIMLATIAVVVVTLPARAWQMYAPDVQGRSEATQFQVLP